MSRYLLGQLSETEEAALEQAFFADDEMFERMWEVENDLVDRYVRGRLATDEREQFERHYLASPQHRRRVATARNLLDAADQSASAPGTLEARPSFLQRLTERMRFSPAWQFAMAAGMILLMAGGGWLLLERARLQNTIAAMQAENKAQKIREQELANQITAGTSQRDQLSVELERLRKQPTEPGQSPQPQPVLRIFSFALSPIGVRGSAGQILALPPDADQVQLQLTAPSGDWQSFQAGIRTAERKPVWSRQLKPRAGKVMVRVPAAKLPFNDYILTLSGVNRAGEIQEINRYSFRVIRD